MKNVVFSLDGVVTLTVQAEGGAEVQLPLNRVMGISEFVVAKSDAVSFQSRPSPVSGSGSIRGGAAKGAEPCRFCGHEMTPDSFWCPACGRAQS